MTKELLQMTKPHNSSAKPRILLIHSEVRPYRVDLFERLHQAYDVTFLFVHGSEWIKLLPEAKTWKYRYFKPWPIPGYTSDASVGVIPYLIKEKNNYDIILCSGLFSFTSHVGYVLAKVLRKKIILWDETWVLPRNVPTKIMTPYFRMMARGVNAGIAAGSKAKELYVSLGMKADTIFLAPNCAEDLRPLILPARTSELRTELKLTKDNIVIGYLGRIVAYKNLDALITAFAVMRADFPQTVLLIIGDGPYAAHCEALLQELGNERVIWLKGNNRSNAIEPMSHDDFIHYLDLTDIFVLPGRFVYADMVPAEAWGLTLNEALSLKKPVIAADSVAAAYDLITDKNGLRIASDSSEAVTVALKKMLAASPKEREAMGEASRAHLDAHFTYAEMAAGFAAAIDHVLNR